MSDRYHFYGSPETGYYANYKGKEDVFEVENMVAVTSEKSEEGCYNVFIYMKNGEKFCPDCTGWGRMDDAFNEAEFWREEVLKMKKEMEAARERSNESENEGEDEGEDEEYADDAYMLPGDINVCTMKAYKTAKEKGFYDEEHNFGMDIALVQSELSEALEEYRKGMPLRGVAFDEDGTRHGILPELADAVIRIMTICGSYNLDLGGEILRKMEYNKSRSYRHGGKKEW